MELRHLRSFCVVAEELHVTRAAKRLHIAQPALTQQIHALEEDLEVMLLNRVGRGIELTEAGRYFRTEAEALLQRARNIRLRSREIGNNGVGRLTVAMSDAVALAPGVASLFHEYKRKWPEVSIAFERRPPLEMNRALKDGLIDVGLCCRTELENGSVTEIPVEPISILAAVPSGHPIARRRSIPLQQFKDQPIILVSLGKFPGSFEEKLRAECGKLGFAPRVVQETPDVMLALNFVSAGLGISFVPDTVRTFDCEAIRYVPLRPPGLLSLRPALVTRAEEQSVNIANLKALAQSREVSRRRTEQMCTR